MLYWYCKVLKSKVSSAVPLPKVKVNVLFACASLTFTPKVAISPSFTVMSPTPVVGSPTCTTGPSVMVAWAVSATVSVPLNKLAPKVKVSLGSGVLSDTVLVRTCTRWSPAASSVIWPLPGTVVQLAPLSMLYWYCKVLKSTALSAEPLLRVKVRMLFASAPTILIPNSAVWPSLTVISPVPVPGLPTLIFTSLSKILPVATTPSIFSWTVSVVSISISSMVTSAAVKLVTPAGTVMLLPLLITPLLNDNVL